MPHVLPLSPQKIMADNNAFYADVGRKIRAARLKKKITQEELASAVSLTRTSITNIERGRQKLLIHTLASIADAIGVAAGTLLPEKESDSDVLLDRAIEKHPEDERAFIKSIVRSASRQGAPS